MPIVQIHLLEGRDKTKKNKLVKSVTTAICDSLGVPPENVRIILSEMRLDHYAIGGTMIEDQSNHHANKP